MTIRLALGLLVTMATVAHAGASATPAGEAATATPRAQQSESAAPGESPALAGRSDGSVGGSLWRPAGAALLTLGLLCAASRYLRVRAGGGSGPRQNGRLKIADRVPIDHRRCILLIEADGQRIVAAAAAEHIVTLAVLPGRDGGQERGP